MRRLVTLLFVGLLLGACGSSVESATDGAADAAGSAATTPSATDEDAAAGPDASESAAIVPFGVVETVDGGTVDGADYAGKSLALWFWAPW